jgi:hypothetical protein
MTTLSAETRHEVRCLEVRERRRRGDNASCVSPPSFTRRITDMSLPPSLDEFTTRVDYSRSLLSMPMHSIAILLLLQQHAYYFAGELPRHAI